MRVRLKKQQQHNVATQTPVQAKQLGRVRPMESSLFSSQTPQTQDQQSQPTQQGFNFAEMPIFAEGADGSVPRVQPQLFTGARAGKATQQNRQNTGNLAQQLVQLQESEEETQAKLEPIQRTESQQINLGPTGIGEPMPKTVQRKMERAFGADFSGVRIHEGPQAKAINAIAYTQGSDIHFQPGKYQPDSQSGQELLGHELTHVVQQKAGRVSVTQRKGIPLNVDTNLETEADVLGAKAARGEQVQVAGVNSPDLMLEKSDYLSKDHQFSQNINSNSGTTIQRFLSQEDFKEEHIGFFTSEGKTINEIRVAMKDYEKASPRVKDITVENLDMSMLLEMYQSAMSAKELIDIYLTSQKKRLEYMSSQVRQDEYNEKLNFKQKRYEKIKQFNDKLSEEIKLITGEITKRSKNKEAPVFKPDIKFNEVREKYGESSLKSVFTHLSKLADVIAPREGDKGNVYIEFSIPVGGGLSVGAILICDVERLEDGFVKLRGEIKITTEAGIPDAIALKGTLGGYIESQAKGAENAGLLMSYAMYRRFEESTILPREVSNLIWGGTTSEFGFLMAEKNAAKIEKEIFGNSNPEKTYAETGGIGSASIKAGNGNYGAKIELQHSEGKRYTKSSIAEKKKGGLGSYRESQPLILGEAQENIGEDQTDDILSIVINTGCLSGSVGISLISKEVTFSFGGSFSAQESLSRELFVNELLAGFIAIKDFISESPQAAESELQKVGHKASQLGDILIAVTQLAQIPKEDSELFSAYEESAKGQFEQTANYGLLVNGEIKPNDGTHKLSKLNLEFTKSVAISALQGVIAAKVSTSHKVAEWKYDGKQWKKVTSRGDREKPNYQVENRLHIKPGGDDDDVIDDADDFD